MGKLQLQLRERSYLLSERTAHRQCLFSDTRSSKHPAQVVKRSAVEVVMFDKYCCLIAAPLLLLALHPVDARGWEGSKGLRPSNPPASMPCKSTSPTWRPDEALTQT